MQGRSVATVTSGLDASGYTEFGPRSKREKIVYTVYHIQVNSVAHTLQF